MFIFKGISTKDMKIIVEEPENLIAKAPLKHEVLNIEGRDDAIYHPLGYAPVEIPLTLQLLDPSKIDQVLMWLNGEGELVYKNRKTKARIFSEIQPMRTAGIRIINIEIIRAPFWYDLEDDYSEAWGANLIPNGWDSFEPYGTEGNEIQAPIESLEEGYLRNYFSYTHFVENGTNDKEESGFGQPFNNIWTALFKLKPKTRYRVTTNVPERDDYGNKNVFAFRDGDKASSMTNGVSINQSLLITTDETGVLRVTKRDFLNQELINEKFWIQIVESETIVPFRSAWEDIPLNKKPVRVWENMMVYISNLNNGLTRIQTWGGNNQLKLNDGSVYGEINKKTYSIYIENKNKESLFLRSFPMDYVEVAPNDEVFVRFSLDSNAGLKFAGSNVDSNLDFIASTPIIVEGYTPPTWEADANPRIVNEGTAPSKPLIKLTKGTSSTCEFEVNGVYFKYHFNHDTEVLIDCEKMEASDNGQLRNRHLTIGYEFPVLEPGPNVVKRISGDAKIEFKRKDRWL